MGTSMGGGRNHKRQTKRHPKRGRKQKRRTRTSRPAAGLNPGKPAAMSLKERLREADRERERQRRFTHALATAMANVNAEAAIATPAHDIQTAQEIDLSVMYGTPPQTIADMTAALRTFARAARVNQYLTDQLQRSLETIRRDGSMNTSLAEARSFLPIARAAMRAYGAPRAIPEGNIHRWREIPALLETIGHNHGLIQDRNTGRWRAIREGETAPQDDGTTADAVAVLEALIRPPPPGPFAKFKGFGRSPPSPSSGASGFSFDPPPPPPDGFKF
jgi:hypothetical protein